jgi:uncharacterized protein YjbI with pentapeptide repeats
MMIMIGGLQTRADLREDNLAGADLRGAYIPLSEDEAKERGALV